MGRHSAGVKELSGMGTARSDWLEYEGPRSDMVVSCRIRLARNLSYMPFCHRATVQQLRRIVALIVPAVESCQQMGGARVSPLDEMTHQERGLLVEENVISKELAGRKEGRAVVYVPDGKVSVMINEEDHLRVQSLEGGLQLGHAYGGADDLEDALSEQIEFAFDNRFGYLTACPTNVGTGMRASIMVHLPGLVMTKQLVELLSSVSEQGYAIRGFRGEGTEAFGDFYQMSNQTTLGQTESEIIEKLERQVENVLAEEERARNKLFSEERRRCEDMIWRAVGTLRQVRILSYEEFMSLLSHVRLGVALGVLSGYDLGLMNRLMIETQPAHVVALLDGECDAFAVDCARADRVRAEFSQQVP